MSERKLLNGTIIITGAGSDDADAIVTEADMWAHDIVAATVADTETDLALIAKLAALHGEINALVDTFPDYAQKQFVLISHSIAEARKGVGVHVGPPGSQ